MDWMSIIAVMLPIAGLFVWNRSEARTDARQMDANNRAMDAKFTALITAIHLEMKDFHGKLCAIEERYRAGTNQTKSKG